MSYALLFSGQASQHSDMLPWLETEPACDDALAIMSAHLGADWRQQLKDPQTRSNNAFAQVVITGTSLAAWAAIGQHLQCEPTVVVGYSVGELPAFGCAGVINTTLAIELAALRAQWMDRAVAHLDTGLLAVTGVSESAVLRACAALGLECAIRIGDNHGIFAGTDASLTRAMPILFAIGANCTRLEVHVASHSSWMISAASAYAQALRTTQFVAPKCLVGMNASGTLSRHVAPLRRALSQQLASTVQWSALMDAVAERHVTCVLEVGAGSALSRMWQERHPHIPARSLDDFRQPHTASDWIQKTISLA
jgi:[acyl-carrier-protein] S-malonyltransferase